MKTRCKSMKTDEQITENRWTSLKTNNKQSNRCLFSGAREHGRKSIEIHDNQREIHMALFSGEREHPRKQFENDEHI